MSSRTLVLASATLGIFAVAWVAGCDSGHKPTVRQRTLAVGGPAPLAEAAKSDELPEGHPKIQRPSPPRKVSPLGPAAAESPPSAGSGEAHGPASKGLASATSQAASEAVPEKSDGPPPNGNSKSRSESSPKAEQPIGGSAAKGSPAETQWAAADRAKGTPPRASAAKEATRTSGGKDAGELSNRRVQIGNLRLEAPREWLRKKPPIDFILAEFVLPRAPGDPEDAQLTVTAVGPNNPDRLNQLRDQLKKSPGQATVEHLKISGVEVILVDASANYGEMPGVFAPEVREGRYRVLNAIVPVGEKLYFVNCSGPEKTVGNYARQFRDFLLGMKAADAP